MKITIDLTDTLEYMIKKQMPSRSDEIKAAAKPKRKVKASAGKGRDPRFEKYTLALMALDDRDDDYDKVKLEKDIQSYIQDLFKKSNRKEVVAFLNENKHRLTPEMKDCLKADVLKNLEK